MAEGDDIPKCGVCNRNPKASYLNISRYRDLRFLFAYGSLMWNAGFQFRGCRRAIVIGFKRRFWNYSYDHRGTASDPGLVVCAVETSNRADIIEGLLIEIPSDNVEGILNMLDVREKCG